MTNKIGALEIPYLTRPPTVSLSGNILKVSGYFATRAELAQLQEMCRKAEGGTSIHTFVGGIQTGFDCTEGSVLTQYCEFDADHIKDGYYLIRSLNINFENYPSHYPFSLELMFLGTPDYLQAGYSVYGLEEIENSWGI